MIAFSLILLLVAKFVAGQSAEPPAAIGPPVRSLQTSPTPPPDSDDARVALPPALVVVKDAREVVRRRVELDPDALSVSYKVRAPYPADVVLEEVRTRLEGSGWEPLPRESINAMYPSALKVGWRSHVVDSGKVESFVWNAQWSNPAGDVVAYTLTYKSGPPEPGRAGPNPDNDDLRVHAQLTKNRLVRLADLPASLIVLGGARDVSARRDRAYDLFVFDGGGKVSATRDKDRAPDKTTVVYTLAARRPPSEVMSALDERLSRQGWMSEAEKPPAWIPVEKWAQTHKPGWNSGSARGHKGFQEWRSNWTNQAGDSLVYVLICDAAPPAPEAPTSGTVDFHIEATVRSLARKPGKADP